MKLSSSISCAPSVGLSTSVGSPGGFPALQSSLMDSQRWQQRFSTLDPLKMHQPQSWTWDIQLA